MIKTTCMGLTAKGEGGGGGGSELNGHKPLKNTKIERRCPLIYMEGYNARFHC